MSEEKRKEPEIKDGDVIIDDFAAPLIEALKTLYIDGTV